MRFLFTPTAQKRTLFYLASDAVVVLGASLLTYAVATRYAALGSEQLSAVLPYAAAGFVCQAAISFLLSTYNLKWATFSLNDAPRVALPGIITALVLGGLSASRVFETLTPWAALTWGLLDVGGVVAVRGAKRFFQEVIRRNPGKRAIVVVCGDSCYFGLDMLRKTTRPGYRLVGCVDPEPRNRGAVVQRLPVLGSFEDIEQVVVRNRVEAAFVLLSANPLFATGELHQRLHDLGLEVQFVPALADVINNRADIGSLERQTIHELTGLPPVVVDQAAMRRVFGGRRILVTGAGGSIGSELCRQLARFDPATLALFERDDTNLFYVERELRAGWPKLDVVPFLGDITRVDDVERAFGAVRPEIVFHAAAYKHVPILEFHPAEAVRVNVLGTNFVARAAIENGARSFVYISTDKSVNPSSVMGASKRIGESVAMALNGTAGCRFVAVRFGNVLDSRGSVSTVFRDAISRRRPITVTHPDMKRYLMLTSEAVLLVMQAVALGEGGEVFVLDMGKPVLIRALAETMVRHAGLRPGLDIPIVVTGRRPGEKLFEELLTAEEGTIATAHPRIFRARNGRPGGMPALERLEAALASADPEPLRSELLRQVENYQPDTGCLNGRPTASGRAVPGPGVARSGFDLEAALAGMPAQEEET
ncbi:polysaccharide biosynthesis protein [candidate division WOR-3 bacterium]|nr:polysaccharide biosynthesis protein [candidate division WOR-3 bacterium]